MSFKKFRWKTSHDFLLIPNILRPGINPRFSLPWIRPWRLQPIPIWSTFCRINAPILITRNSDEVKIIDYFFMYYLFTQWFRCYYSHIIFILFSKILKKNCWKMTSNRKPQWRITRKIFVKNRIRFWNKWSWLIIINQLSILYVRNL